MNFIKLFSHNKKFIVKLSFIVCFIALILVESIAYLTPQRGYEVSFYSSTPSIIFVLVGVAIVGGIYILFQQAVSENYRNSKIWIGGFLLLLLTRMIILYLPYIRGYYTWMGDNSTHLGLVKEALIKGYVDSNNFYPVSHILLTQVALVTSLPADFVANHSTAVFSILFIIGIFLLAKLVFDDGKPIILTIAAVGCVIFSGYELYLMPNGWSCLFLPFAIYLIIRSMGSKQNVSFQILALVAIVLFPFFHPFSTLLLLLLLFIFVIITSAFRNEHIFHRFVPSVLRANTTNPYPRFNNMSLFLMGIGITIWSLWIVSFHSFNANIRSLVSAIITSETVDVVGAMAEKAGKMDLNLIDIFILLIKDYGDELFFVATFFVGIFIFIKYRRYFSHADSLLLISIPPITFSIFYLVYFFGLAPGLDSINATRVHPYIVLFAPIFTGIFFCYALSKKRPIVTYFCFILIVMPALLALFGVFPDPYLHRPTPDITEMDLSGMGWSFQYKDIDIPYAYIMSPPDRFADIILGRTEREKRSDIDHMVKIPDHFDYRQNRYLGESYATNSYAAITKFDTILYDTAYKQVGRFHSADFDRLQADPTVNRIYSNNESTVYFIHAVG